MEQFDMPHLRHGTAELEPQVRMHHVVAGRGNRTLVMLHGYPQTWYEWRHVLSPLVRAAWRVIAPYTAAQVVRLSRQQGMTSAQCSGHLKVVA